MTKLRVLSKRLPVRVSLLSLLTVSVFFLTFLLNSCTQENIVFPDESPTTGQGLTVRIPNISKYAEFAKTRTDANAMTRAEVDATVDEAKIDNLYLGAINTENNSLRVLKLSFSSSLSSSEYQECSPINLPAGSYRFYLLANLEDYYSSNLSTLSIQEIENLVLNFGNTSDAFNLQSDCLPMCCLPQDIKKDPTDANGVGENSIELSSETATAIYADLTFLCSKVRYTLLFDKNDPNNDFSGNSVDFKSASANNVRQETAIDKGIASEETLNGVALSLLKAKYPSESDDTEGYLNLASGETAPKFLDEVNGWEENDNQRAWQGVAYFPENLLEESKATKLSFEPDGTEMQPEYVLPLYWEKNGTGKGMERGHYYDVAGKINKKDNSNLAPEIYVSPWTLENLSYSLHGPFELIVETTEVNVSTGNWSESFWYKSDVSPEEIKFSYPKIQVDGKDMNFYVAEVVKKENTRPGVTAYETNENGDYMVHVMVNPEIPYNVLKTLDSETKLQPYTYFEIIAGNIQKKIKIGELDLKAILDVSPKEILIDLREYLSSGTNAEDIEIEFVTNLTEGDFTISCDTPDILNGNGVLTVIPANGVSINNSGVLSVNSGKLILRLSDLLKGGSFWNTEHKIVLTFTVTVDGSEDLKETVTITVKPYTTDYIIHFKCSDPNLNWDNPHVYIYQCLEIPANYTDENGNKVYVKNYLRNDNGDYTESETTIDMAGKTVGYDNYNPQAALEYLFSNNISFRGWKGYGGTVSPYEDGTEYRGGFLHIGGVVSLNQSKFNPATGDTEIYNYDSDFNHSHELGRDNWACEKCRNYVTPNDYNRKNGGLNGSHMFAGVSMEKETGANEGWYKYRLTGVATPGKTLIIFYNGHEWDGDIVEANYRYPSKDKNGKDTAGIPLFDFADNEGWFLFDGDSQENTIQGFQDDKPGGDAPGEEANALYRLYWPIYRGPWLYLKSGNEDITSLDTQGKLDLDLGYYYYDLTKEYSGTIDYVFDKYPGDDRNTGTFDMATLRVATNSDGLYCGYFQNSTKKEILAGEPERLWNSKSSSGGESTSIYLRGLNNNWNISSEYQFSQYYYLPIGDQEFQVWKLENVTINSSEEFKIADNSYSNIDLGSNGNNLMSDTVYPLVDKGGNINQASNFSGTVYLIRHWAYNGTNSGWVSNVYTLYLKSE